MRWVAETCRGPAPDPKLSLLRVKDLKVLYYRDRLPRGRGFEFDDLPPIPGNEQLPSKVAYIPLRHLQYLLPYAQTRYHGSMAECAILRDRVPETPIAWSRGGSCWEVRGCDSQTIVYRCGIVCHGAARDIRCDSAV
jgi:hypothetical protein